MYDHALLITQVLGVATRAGSVYLISSMDRKPSRKGRARPCPKQHHPVPPFILNQVLTIHWKPKPIPIKTQLPQGQNTHKTSRPFCHTAHTRTHLISCVGWVTTRHRNHICFKPSSASVQPYSPLDHTGVQCLNN